MSKFNDTALLSRCVTKAVPDGKFKCVNPAYTCSTAPASMVRTSADCAKYTKENSYVCCTQGGCTPRHGGEELQCAYTSPDSDYAHWESCGSQSVHCSQDADCGCGE